MEEQLDGQMNIYEFLSIFDNLTDVTKIKATYIGVTCHQIIKGKTYDVEIDFDKFIVSAKVNDFTHNFKYGSMESLKTDWKF